MHLKNKTDSTTRKDMLQGHNAPQTFWYQHQTRTVNVYIVCKYYARVFDVTHQNSFILEGNGISTLI